MRSPTMAVLALCCLIAEPLRAEKRPPLLPIEHGTVSFQPPADESAIPTRYRLAAFQFSYDLTGKHVLPASNIEVYHLTFPSPVKSPSPENNMVHADYYRPPGPGPFPCVIVLDILAGNEKVARLCASTLAQNGLITDRAGRSGASCAFCPRTSRTRWKRSVRACSTFAAPPPGWRRGPK
jgi:hypothetical protein